MIAIDNILVSDQIISEQFVCDLAKCKGGCCEDGDAGAPLEKEELVLINEIYEQVKPYITEAGRKEIESRGRYNYDQEFGWVTPTIGGKMCAYGFRDEKGVIKCGIEQAYDEGRTNWKKPISCHLYPVKTKKNKKQDLEYVNYEPRESMCDPACSLGKKLQVPVYKFLKEALVRKYGDEFYSVLEQVAKEYFEIGKAAD